MSAPRTLTPTQWFSAAELAALALPGLPTSKRGMIALAQRQGWAVRVGSDGLLSRPRKGRGGGVEYHVSLLPDLPDARLIPAEEAVAAAKAQREALREESAFAKRQAILWLNRANSLEQAARCVSGASGASE